MQLVIVTRRTSPRWCAGFGNTSPPNSSGFTLIEVMLVMGMILILITAGMGAVLSMDVCSRRTADYNAALAIVEAKMEDIRAATYNPPSSPWTAGSVSITNNNSISLNQAGTTFRISGTVVSNFRPIPAGHLVTVTGTFQDPTRPYTITLQSVMNAYSGGQQ